MCSKQSTVVYVELCKAACPSLSCCTESVVQHRGLTVPYTSPELPFRFTYILSSPQKRGCELSESRARAWERPAARVGRLGSQDQVCPTNRDWFCLVNDSTACRHL